MATQILLEFLHLEISKLYQILWWIGSQVSKIYARSSQASLLSQNLVLKKAVSKAKKSTIKSHLNGTAYFAVHALASVINLKQTRVTICSRLYLFMLIEPLLTHVAKILCHT